MDMNLVEKVQNRVLRLPDSLILEVLNFIDYLEYRHGLPDPDIDNLKKAQIPVMNKIWDNTADDIWNDL